MSDAIIDRIRKLLGLAKSTNEHEAAAAAARAAELMARYDLDEAALRVEDSSRTAEEIIEGTLDGTEGKANRVMWQVYIAAGAAEAFGVRTWTAGGRVQCMGRKSAVGAWNYTCQYLYREVNRLADDVWESSGRWKGGSVRSWKNAFRLGAASVIRARLVEQSKASVTIRAESARALGMSPSAASTALAVIDRDREALEEAYQGRSKGFRRSSSPAHYSSSSGYDHGRQAGASVQLSGGRGLPAPAKAIKS